MSRSDDLRLGIGEQHWSTIGGKGADHEPRSAGYDRIGFRHHALRKWPVNCQCDVAVALINCDQLTGCGTQMPCDPVAVRFDPGAIVVRAQAAVEQGVNAIGSAALPGEEAMANARQLCEMS